MGSEDKRDESDYTMILEGIITTTNSDGTTNVAPMGLRCDVSMMQLVLQPFQSSTTYANLKRTGKGVFHVVDDVMLLAQAAIGQFDSPPRFLSCEAVGGQILADSCRWYAFRIVTTDDVSLRAKMVVEAVESGRLHEFFGFNRAKHAIVEAAILATRIGFLPHTDILAELPRLAELVEKTGGEQEHTAFALLSKYIREKCDVNSTTTT